MASPAILPKSISRAQAFMQLKKTVGLKYSLFLISRYPLGYFTAAPNLGRQAWLGRRRSIEHIRAFQFLFFSPNFGIPILLASVGSSFAASLAELLCRPCRSCYHPSTSKLVVCSLSCFYMYVVMRIPTQFLGHRIIGYASYVNGILVHVTAPPNQAI